MRKINCCWNCEDRYLGCHSECDKYKGEKEELVKTNEMILAKKKEASNSVCESSFSNFSGSKREKRKNNQGNYGYLK